MGTNTFVEINIPEAIALADLTGIFNDFESAKQFAVHLKEILGRNPPDYILVEPMTVAILVRYNRPFTSGVRHRLKEDELETLSLDQRKNHNYFRSWRDKHIAHPVNVFEKDQPVARYWIEHFDDEGFTSIECNSSQLTGMSLHDIEKIIELTTHFIEELKPKINR